MVSPGLPLLLRFSQRASVLTCAAYDTTHTHISELINYHRLPFGLPRDIYIHTLTQTQVHTSMLRGVGRGRSEGGRNQMPAACCRHRQIPHTHTTRYQKKKLEERHMQERAATIHIHLYTAMHGEARGRDFLCGGGGGGGGGGGVYRIYVARQIASLFIISSYM